MNGIIQCKVFYGKASTDDIGVFSGTHKKRLELSDKTKKLSIALFEPYEIDNEEKYITWVSLADSEKGEILAEISSLSKRLDIPEKKIIRLAKIDDRKSSRLLENEIRQRVEEYLSIQKFVKNTFYKNLTCHQLTKVIHRELGMMTPEIKRVWNDLIKQNNCFPLYIDDNWDDFFHNLKKIDKNIHDICLKADEELKKDWWHYDEDMEYNKKRQSTIFQILERLIRPEMKQLRDKLLGKIAQSPENYRNHLNQFFENLYLIDKTFFSDLIPEYIESGGENIFLPADLLYALL